MAVELFHIEASLESLVCLLNMRRYNNFLFMCHFMNSQLLQVDACARIDMILGVLGWSTGCSWSENKQFLECQFNGLMKSTCPAVESLRKKFCPLKPEFPFSHFWVVFLLVFFEKYFPSHPLDKYRSKQYQAIWCQAIVYIKEQQ